MSLATRTALDRIAVEHMRHAGKANGRLPVTFQNFEEYGLRRQSIALALKEGEALGWFERTQEGKRGWGSIPGKAALYRLTFLPSVDATDVWPATNEWSKIKDIASAQAIIAKVRADYSQAKTNRKARTVDASKVVRLPKRPLPTPKI